MRFFFNHRMLLILRSKNFSILSRAIKYYQIKYYEIIYVPYNRTNKSQNIKKFGFALSSNATLVNIMLFRNNIKLPLKKFLILIKELTIFWWKLTIIISSKTIVQPKMILAFINYNSDKQIQFMPLNYTQILKILSTSIILIKN